MEVQRNKLLSLLTNPYVLSFIPALAIMWFIPVNHNRYLLEEEGFNLLEENHHVYYEDLDGDGYSEKIVLHERRGTTGFTVYNHLGIAFNEWNVRGRYDFERSSGFFLTGDYNGDGQKELFLFTASNDSILLHGLFDLESDTITIRDRFIAVTGTGNFRPDPFIVPAEMDDLNGDGRSELIFAVSTGFSRFPRTVYAYYIDEDSLVSSPESSYIIHSLRQADISGNGKREIFVNGHASSNVPPEQARYHDHSNWVMVLDHNLQFLFEPVEIPGRFNALQAFPLKTETGYHIGAIRNRHVGGGDAEFYRVSAGGEILEKKLLGGSLVYAFLAPGHNKRELIAVTTGDNDLHVYDQGMKLKKKFPDMGIYLSLYEGLLKTGQPQIIAYNVQLGSLIIFHSGFRHPTMARLAEPKHTEPIITFNYRGELPPQVSIQLGTNHYLYDYRPNPMYYLNFGFYPLTYMAVLLFAMLIRRQYRNQLDREKETERKITELQLHLVKNQLDPHFSLNALNAVMHAAQEQRYEAVESGLSSFSKLYRSMLLSAGRIRRSLEEELAFTENYLELEKLRYEDRFDYRIDMAPEVDKSVLLPKMIIQLHAENAVKHGLAPLEGGGLLRIGAEVSDGKLILTIEDNGVGRPSAKPAAGGHDAPDSTPLTGGGHEAPGKAPATDSQSTGMGLTLMEELYGLYQKFYGQQIIADIADLTDAQGQPAGTRVRIVIF